MVAQYKWPYIMPEEYLAREKDAETRSEYIDGVIVAMSGGSRNHDAIAFTLMGETYPHLRKAGCSGYTSNMRVSLNLDNRYYYPDYTIVCGKPQIEVLQAAQSLLNPSVIFEILLPSTERADRREKWSAYQQIESLTTYILVHQDKPQVEMYSRTSPAAEWVFTEASGLDSAIHLAPVGCDLTLAQIYADVELGPSDQPSAEQ